MYIPMYFWKIMIKLIGKLVECYKIAEIVCLSDKYDYVRKECYTQNFNFPNAILFIQKKFLTSLLAGLQDANPTIQPYAMPPPPILTAHRASL